MTKRLFIFAGYDKDEIIDNTVLYYLKALGKLGDIVFYMDNNVTDFEISKVRKIPNVLHAVARRHKEYDFGSYKRGYIWSKKILKNYDWIYLVNDSVYGPLFDLKPVLENLESRDADAIGMYYAVDKNKINHLQSWFIGLKRNVATAAWFNDFMRNIKSQKEKTNIIIKYEFGLTNALESNCKISGFIQGTTNDDCFRNPMRTLAKGIPFIKKSPYALGKIDSQKNIEKYVSDNLLKIIGTDMFRKGLSFGKYSKIWDIRLFGIIPLIALWETKPGSAQKLKLTLFKKIKVLDILF